MNFHEKALFVKADVAATMTVCVGYPCHASMRTLSVSSLLVARCIMGSPSCFGLPQALPSSERSLRRETGPSSLAQSVAYSSEIRSDRVTPACVVLGLALCRNHHLLLSLVAAWSP